MLSGYAGKIGWVDLNRRTTRVEALDQSTAGNYLGGKALGAYLLYSHLKPNIDPYDPANMLIFITGPLTGTPFPAASRSAVITRSPMTGTILDSYAGGFFGPHLKRAGFDILIIVGKAKNPAYVLVEEGKIKIEAANHLWGLSTSGTETRLQEQHKKEKGERISIAAIGPAGEKLVRFSNIVNNGRCYGCSRKTTAITDDREYVAAGPEYETMYSFGSNCDIKEPEMIIAADKICTDYGLDTISCGVVIGFAMECFEKGLITSKNTGGIDLTFGSGDALLACLHLIGRREGIGQILAEGVKRASDRIDGSSDFAMHLKGLELPGYDPRGMKGFARRDDTLPSRLFSQAATRGPSQGEVVERDAFEKMLDEYYQCMGWDKRTGQPTEEKLKALGLR